MIERACQERNIQELVHFTDVRHLPSIVQFGLLPRNQINGLQTDTYPNDLYRLDGHPDSVSVSISFPNDKMFFKYRKQSQSQFAIVCLHPSVLWILDSAFYPDNAASAQMSQLDPDDLKSPAAFNAMFEEIDGVRSREEQKLQGYHTTNEQAEVLVFGEIPPQFITRIVFNDSNVQQLYQPSLAGKPTVLHGANSGYFGTRTFMLEY